MQRALYLEPIESEKEYQRAAQLGRELKVPTLELFLELKVTLQDNSDESLYWVKQRSHSWTRNAYNLLACLLMGIRGTGAYAAGGLAIKDWNGTVQSANDLPVIGRCCSYGPRSDDPEAGSNTLRGPVGNDSFGILVGVGTGAESFEDFALGSRCTEGTTAGKLNYMAMGAQTKSWDGPSKSLTVIYTRYINNNSPGTINIGEIALVTQAAHNNSYVNTILSRDLISPVVAVPASGQILATYTLALVYP